MAARKRKQSKQSASSPSTAPKLRRRFLPLFAPVILVVIATAWFLSQQPPRGTRSTDENASVASTASKANVTDAGKAQLLTSATADRWSQLRGMMDPNTDGWGSEAAADEVTRQIKRFAPLLTRDVPVTVTDIFSLATNDSTSDPLVPSKLITKLKDDVVQIRRAAPVEPTDQLSLTEALNQIVDRNRGHDDQRVTFKVFRIAVDNELVSATVLFEDRYASTDHMFQLNARWHTQWRPADDGSLQLASISVNDFEEIQTNMDGQPWLSDCTEAVLSKNESYRDQLAYGAGYWMQIIPSYLSPRLLEGHMGVSVGDVNEDGLDDIYVCQPGGLPNRLYVQELDGTVTDISKAAGVDMLDWAYSSLIIDLDNDGHQDLAVLADTKLHLFRGDGTGKFAPQPAINCSCEFSLTAADYDGDGDLDLYACNYYAETSDDLAQLRRSDPLHDSNTGGRNVLYQNQGNWQFQDVTSDVGLDARNRRWSLAAAWEDYDNDGDLDLYVANDFGHNNLYRNEGGKFSEIAEASGVVDAKGGMSATWADYDHDGWMDLYVSNMFSAAGSRVTFQPQFMPGVDESIKQLYQELARGNSLFSNLQGRSFKDVSVDTGVTMGRWAWASLFADLNNDSWDDLLIANGYLTQNEQDDL